MSGPSAKYVYTADDGTDYSCRMPTWEATLQSGVAATTEPSMPKGLLRRKRYYKITATGKEGSVTVLNPTNAIYLNPFGTGVIIPLFNAAIAGSNNATLQGRTGERTRNI